MRAIWTGAIKLGRMQIPVGLAPAREANDPDFRTLHRDCLTPVKQLRVCTGHGKRPQQLESGETIKGWEIAPGEYLPIEDADLEAASPLASSHRIELLGTVLLADLDPLAIDRPYFLAPSSSEIGHKAYAVFAEAVHQADVAIICRFQAWGREQLAAISPHGDGRALILQTLLWAEDIRSHDIDLTLAPVKVDAADRQAAGASLAKLAGKAKLEKLKSSHRAAIRKLLDDRLAAAKRPKRRSAVRKAA